MDLRLEATDTVAPESRELLAALVDAVPREEPVAVGKGKKFGGAEVVAILALVVALPQGVDALLNLRDRLDRRRIRNTLRALKAKLEAEGGAAVLHLPSGREVDLASTGTDAAIDLIIKELGGP